MLDSCFVAILTSTIMSKTAFMLSVHNLLSEFSLLFAYPFMIILEYREMYKATSTDYELFKDCNVKDLILFL